MELVRTVVVLRKPTVERFREGETLWTLGCEPARFATSPPKREGTLGVRPRLPDPERPLLMISSLSHNAYPCGQAEQIKKVRGHQGS